MNLDFAYSALLMYVTELFVDALCLVVEINVFKLPVIQVFNSQVKSLRHTVFLLALITLWSVYVLDIWIESFQYNGATLGCAQWGMNNPDRSPIWHDGNLCDVCNESQQIEPLAFICGTGL